MAHSRLWQTMLRLETVKRPLPPRLTTPVSEAMSVPSFSISDRNQVCVPSTCGARAYPSPKSGFLAKMGAATR